MLVDRECGCNDTDPFECVNPDSPDSEVDGNWRCDCECHGEGLTVPDDGSGGPCPDCGRTTCSMPGHGGAGRQG
jgi:hypothetical protein